jgi:hypothetical protein
MWYFTTCYACEKLQQLDADDYGTPLEGIGCGVELDWPDDDPIDEDELCFCED